MNVIQSKKNAINNTERQHGIILNVDNLSAKSLFFSRLLNNETSKKFVGSTNGVLN